MREVTAMMVIVLVLLIGCSKPANGVGNIGSLQIEIWANSNCVKQGESVTMRAIATNVGATPRIIQLQDKPVLNIQINYRLRSGDPTELKQLWSEGKLLTPELTRLALKPGESKSIEMDWVAQHAAGQSSQIDLRGILRYGEKEADVAIARTFISVDTCP